MSPPRASWPTQAVVVHGNAAELRDTNIDEEPAIPFQPTFVLLDRCHRRSPVDGGQLNRRRRALVVAKLGEPTDRNLRRW